MQSLVRSLNWFVVQFAFKSLVVGDLAHGLHEVLLDDVLAFGTAMRKFIVKKPSYSSKKPAFPLTGSQKDQLRCKHSSNRPR
jgi:hypothetical protein